MSSLTRSEYRHEEQRRVTESPFKETKWDRHLDTLLTDLNDSVGTPPGSLQRSVVPATSSSGVITAQHGVPGSGDFHERREYLAPDQRTRVVQERYEHTTRADGGNQAVTKQVYKSSYSGDPIGAPSQAPGPPPADGSRFKQNILELDSLLDDLDHARKKPGTNGVDTTTSTFDRPAGTSTPYRNTNIQKTTKTTKYTTSGSSEPAHLTPGDQLTALGVTGPRHSPSPNPLDGLDRNLVPELSEPPQPGTTRVTKYEYRTSNQRDVSPQPAPAPARTLPPPESARSYTDRREYTSTTNTLDRAPPPPPPPPPDVTDKTVINYVYSADQTVPPPPPPVVPGQPGNTTINYHIYNYGTLGPDGQPVGLPPGTLSPAGSAPPSEVDGPRGTLPRQVNNTNSSNTTTYRYRDQTPPPPQVNTNTNTTTTTYRYRDQTPPPPQVNTNTNTSTTTTNYRYDQTSPPQQQQKSPPPGPDTTVSNSYVFEKHSRGPTPQRTVQPVQPAQPGGPNTTYTTNTVTKHYTIGPDGTEVPVRTGSPPYDQQCPRFPVDEPPPPPHHTRTTTTTIERSHTHGSPFPARSPSPSGRRPYRDDGPRAPFPGTPRRPVDDIDTPRRVDELMAQIPDTPQDGTYPHGPRRRELNGRSTTTHFTVHESEPLLEGQTKVTLDAKSGAVVPHTATKPMSGPPIYYPPGSTDFKPKPESEMMFQSYESRGGGKYKSGYKAGGKYKAKGGSKESHSEGGAVIPICLPLCCGAACSVM